MEIVDIICALTTSLEALHRKVDEVENFNNCGGREGWVKHMRFAFNASNRIGFAEIC